MFNEQFNFVFKIYILIKQTFYRSVIARRRAAAKRKKLKNLGKSKSTDTEEEEGDDDCVDDGNYLISQFTYTNKHTHTFIYLYI